MLSFLVRPVTMFGWAFRNRKARKWTPQIAAPYLLSEPAFALTGVVLLHLEKKRTTHGSGEYSESLK
jgi:hypothetical protein